MDSYCSKRIGNRKQQIAWLRVIPFIIMHLGCVLVFWVGVSPIAVLTAICLYCLRIFAIGAFYHRYFAHNSFKTNRFWQFIFAILGASAAQRGPLWWAAHHRQHHLHADAEHDPHSPQHQPFLWSHMGWFMTKENYYYDAKRINDLQRFRELRFLTRHDKVVPLLLAVSLFVFGLLCQMYWPALQTSGLQMLVWGFFISTIAVFHVTVSINSFGHKFGKRRFATKDNSRNNWCLALLTFGEGWHNNHHRYAVSARQGLFWWEIDITYYILRLLAALHIIWDIKVYPQQLKNCPASDYARLS